MALGLVKQLQVVIADVRLPGIRPAGDNLHVHLLRIRLVLGPDMAVSLAHKAFSGRLGLVPEITQVLEQIFSGGIIPVQGKTDL